jgi:hypothetical protein
MSVAEPHESGVEPREPMDELAALVWFTWALRAGHQDSCQCAGCREARTPRRMAVLSSALPANDRRSYKRAPQGVL